MKTRRHAVALLSGIIIAVAFSMVPVATLWADPPQASVPPSRTVADAQSVYGHLPLSFEANQGQTDPQVKFLSRGQGYNLFLTSTEAVLTLTSLDRTIGKGSEVEDPRLSNETRQSVLRMGLVGANPAPAISGRDALPGKANYFIGNDPHRWRTNVPTYMKVHYKDVYPGIDLVFYGNQRQLEYDFIVAPGADLTPITFSLDGSDQLTVDAKGDLVLRFGDSDLRLQKPVVYQMVNGFKQPIPGNYRLEDQHHIGFQVAVYDRSKPLIIDPTLAYSTYLGGSGGDQGQSIAVDAAGNAFVTGHTQSVNFPTTAGRFQTTFGGGSEDVFVTKLNPTGSSLVYSTYLGGSGDDFGLGIALDSSTNAYVTGLTASTNFPTSGAFQPALAGSFDAFITKLDSTGSMLIYSSFLGGADLDRGNEIALDSLTNAYVTGQTSSTNFPTTLGSFDTTYNGGGDAFVTKINPTGSGLVYSTYLGGSGGTDSGQDIVVDAGGNAYVTGSVESSDFPTITGAFQTAHAGGTDAFVSKLNATGSGLVYSTFLGGNSLDFGGGIAIDSLMNAYVTGYAASSNFPTTPGTFQPAFSG